MNKFIKTIMITAAFSFLPGCGGDNDPAGWSSAKTDEWFNKGDWRNGWEITPDSSLDRKTFAVSYFRQKERWDSAFGFLKNTDLGSIGTGRHDIDGDNLYAIVSEYSTKNVQDAYFEAHRKYIDIQYVVKGIELIGIALVTSADSVKQEYDPAKDVEFMTVIDGKLVEASPSGFFVFFPADAHKPGLTANTPTPVRKVVIKVRID